MDGVGEYFGYYGSKSNKLTEPYMALAYIVLWTHCHVSKLTNDYIFVLVRPFQIEALLQGTDRLKFCKLGVKNENHAI